MSESEKDIYSTPEAELQTDKEIGSATEFFPISILKLSAMYLLTFGIYGLYWFYKNWKLHKISTGENLRPFWRSVFSIFFVHALFELIQDAYQKIEPDKIWSGWPMASLYVLAAIVSGVSDAISRNTDSMGVADYLSLATLFVMWLPLLSAQKIVNKVNGDPAGKLNAQLSPMNWIFALFGFVVWLLVIVGLLFVS